MAFKKESLTSLKEVDSTVEWDAMYDDDGLDEQEVPRTFTMDAETLDQLDAWRRKRTFSNRRGISTIRRTETRWIQIQHRTFAKWVTEQSGCQIINLRIDFIDGTVLVKLIEKLSGKQVRRYHKSPTSISQKCDNIQLALDICKAEGIRLTNIGTQDIAQGSLKLMLGLIWCLIQRYHLLTLSQALSSQLSAEDMRRTSIGKTEGNNEGVRAKVIRGLNEILGILNLRVSNLKSDWSDGMALTAIVTYIAPQFNRDYMAIESEEYESATDEAMEAAHSYLNIPCLLTAEDFISPDVDELSMITYLSYFLDKSLLKVREDYLAIHSEYVPAYKTHIIAEVLTPPPSPPPSPPMLSPVLGSERGMSVSSLADSPRHSSSGSISECVSSNNPLSPVLDSSYKPQKKSKRKDSMSSNKSKKENQEPDGTGTLTKKSPIKKLYDSYKSQLRDKKSKSKSMPFKKSKPVTPQHIQIDHKEPYNNTGNQYPLNYSHLNHKSSLKQPSNNIDNDDELPSYIECTNEESEPVAVECKISRSSTRRDGFKLKKVCIAEDITLYDHKEISDIGDDIMEIDDKVIKPGGESEVDEKMNNDLSDGETEDILNRILNASDEDEPEDDDPDSEEPTSPLRRCNTTISRPSRMVSRAKPTPKTEAKQHTELQPFFRDHELFAEYKLLCNNVPSGVYVVPSFKSLQVWHGMIFIKIGMFADGCFKFNLYIPDDFPYSRPSLRFVTAVFHPQVKPNGELNLAKAFPTWTPRKDRIWHILRYTKRCFFSINTFDATNAVAAEAVHKSIDTFRNKAKECVENSIKANFKDSIDLPEDDGNVFNSSPLDEQMLNCVKDKMFEGDKPPFPGMGT